MLPCLLSVLLSLLLLLFFNYTGQYRGSSAAEDLRGHHSILRDCIEQLTTIETSRASLVSHLREALQEQVFWHPCGKKLMTWLVEDNLII